MGHKSSICYFNNRTNIKQTTRMKFIFLSLLPSLSPPWLKTRRVVLNLMLMLKLEPDILATDTMDTQSWEVDITTPTMAMPMLATHTTPDMVDTDLMDVTDMDVSSETERTRFCQL